MIGISIASLPLIPPNTPLNHLILSFIAFLNRFGPPSVHLPHNQKELMKNHTTRIIAIVFVVTIIASCTPTVQKTTTCTIKNEYYHNQPSVEYTFDTNSKLSRMDIYDTGALDSYILFNRDGSGVLTSVASYNAGDSLLVNNLVYTNANGKIDSVVTMYDSDGDNIGDQYSASYIYQYTGNDVTAVYARTVSSPVALNNTVTWSSGNLMTNQSEYSQITSTWTYSTVQSPYAAYRNEFLALNLIPTTSLSANMPTLKERRDSNNVLLTTSTYVPSADADGKLVQVIYPSFGDTIVYNYNCIEQ
jgi:hypothetical protein